MSLLLIDLEKITTDLLQSVEFPLKSDVGAVFQKQKFDVVLPEWLKICNFSNKQISRAVSTRRLGADPKSINHKLLVIK